ncbi:hypothetical protein SAMN04488029_1574 [Reichenbachiella faecimaris]|uniref:Uncharacterized protein n=1 Tax=Reichenbachiella faecimaris TaxID=692418 RepID=A0A1W2G987_REIFA|nr:hypothetical protein [Reichenbachiella faecimaris]SMD33227.1 hypothetical protein SAMN04488029_1574 [Reichenbachiella faecimaris]
MSIATRKLRIIEKFTSLEDKDKLSKIESILKEDVSQKEKSNILSELSGSWGNKEADEIKFIIEESCEKIDKYDW